MYHIYVRDGNLNKIGEITDYEKIELIPRFNAVGSFTLDIATDTFAARELIKTKSGIIVQKDGQTIFSGTVTSRYRTFDKDNGDKVTFGGLDDMLHLSRILAYPETNGLFSTQAYDVRTGAAETIMKQYVDYNIGQNAENSRKFLTIETDTGLGSIVTGRARFDNLLDLLASLALQGGGLGFNVVQEGNSLVFKVYQPADKTKSAFFSPILGNISSFDYKNEDPTANLVIVGGSGEGTARILDWTPDNNSIVQYWRREVFVDKRDTTDSTELTNAMNEELTNQAEKNSFSFVPIDTPQLSFGKDYNLGDKVSIVITQPNEQIDLDTLYVYISAFQTVPVQVERIRKIQQKLDVIQDVVREVKITLDNTGETISPTVGSEDSLSKNTPKIIDQMKKLKRRISNLERSW
jgi:hypothetical protein